MLLRRRTVIAELRHIGKEAHRLDDAQTGLIADSNEITSDIADPDDDQLLALALAFLEPHSTAQLAQHLPVSERRLRDVRARRSTPHHAARQALITLACHHAHNGELATPRGTLTWYDEASCLAAHLTATKDPTFDQTASMADRCGPPPLPMRLSTDHLPITFTVAVPPRPLSAVPPAAAACPGAPAFDRTPGLA